MIPFLVVGANVTQTSKAFVHRHQRAILRQQIGSFCRVCSSGDEGMRVFCFQASLVDDPSVTIVGGA